MMISTPSTGSSTSSTFPLMMVTTAGKRAQIWPLTPPDSESCWFPWTHHHPDCWPSQFSQHSLKCYCTLSGKTNSNHTVNLESQTRGAAEGELNAYPNNLLGSGFGCKHAEDARSTADIQNHLVLEQVLVVKHGVAVSQSANLVFQHLLQRREQSTGWKAKTINQSRLLSLGK